MKYYIQQNGVNLGPFTAIEINELLINESITLEDIAASESDLIFRTLRELGFSIQNPHPNITQTVPVEPPPEIIKKINSTIFNDKHLFIRAFDLFTKKIATWCLLSFITPIIIGFITVPIISIILFSILSNQVNSSLNTLIDNLLNNLLISLIMTIVPVAIVLGTYQLDRGFSFKLTDIVKKNNY